MPPTLLLTNDDGVHSPGLDELARALYPLGNVFVVAPDRERSAVSHALTLHSPLRARPISEGRFAVDGTPTDCVNLAIHGLLRRKPDLVVSGINCGGNVGDDITYSGTVAAALEATLMGVQALAFSLAEGPFTHADFRWGAGIAAHMVAKILREGLPDSTFLNINIPKGHPKRVQLTRQGKRRYEDLVVEKTDPRGQTYYWIGGGDLRKGAEVGTDIEAISRGVISVTPLHTDMTNKSAFPILEALKFTDIDLDHGNQGR